MKTKVIRWRCSAGHETDLVLGPEETPTRLDEIRKSFSGGCNHRRRAGVCGAPVRELQA